MRGGRLVWRGRKRRRGVGYKREDILVERERAYR